MRPYFIVEEDIIIKNFTFSTGIDGLRIELKAFIESQLATVKSYEIQFNKELALDWVAENINRI